LLLLRSKGNAITDFTVVAAAQQIKNDHGLHGFHGFYELRSLCDHACPTDVIQAGITRLYELRSLSK